MTDAERAQADPAPADRAPDEPLRAAPSRGEGVLALAVSAPLPPRRVRADLVRQAGPPRAPRTAAHTPGRAEGEPTRPPAAALEAPVEVWCLAWPAGPLGPAHRRALRWAEALGAPGGQGRVALALVWPETPAAEDAGRAAAPAEVQARAQAAAEQLLARVVAANRHGVFVTDGVRDAWPGHFAAFGCYGWRRAVARPWPGRVRAGAASAGLTALGLAAWWLGAWLGAEEVVRRPAAAEARAGTLWLGLDADAEGLGSDRAFDRHGTIVRSGEVLRVLVAAEPGRYGSVLLFDSAGRWSLPDARLVDLRFDAARPSRESHLEVDTVVGTETLFLVTGPRPLGPPRPLEQALNVPGARPLVPPVLHGPGIEAHLRATLRLLLSPEFTVAGRFALEHRP